MTTVEGTVKGEGFGYLVVQVIVTLVNLLQAKVPLVLHMDVRVELPRCCLHELDPERPVESS